MSKAKRGTKPSKAARKVRGTVLSSGFTGVLAMAAGAVMSVPGGIDGLVGTSVAHNLAAREDESRHYGFAEAATPLTDGELRGIQSELDEGAAALDAARASTDSEIERMKALATRHGAQRVAEGAYAPAFDYDALATILLAGRG